MTRVPYLDRGNTNEGTDPGRQTRDRHRIDGFLEVACYCGKRVSLMTPAEVRDGVDAPSCGGDGCY